MALAPYAMDVRKSRGRRYPESPHPYRNDFARDRDRIIHARAFRRLEAKTQVFTARFSDHFRNRLTHTLEVAQVARTVAAALEIDADLTEALALVHDIGHPPFGHAGEKQLDMRMREYGETFDHNVHALRIVEQFEHSYVDFPGLNLTFEVREGIIKHSRDYSDDAFPELREYLLDKRPPLEAQIIDLVDEIAYNTADLDDAFEAHLLEFDQLREGVPIFDSAYAQADRRKPQGSRKLKFNEALRQVLDLLTTDLIENTHRRLESMEIRTLVDVRARPERVAAFTPEFAVQNKKLKKFLMENLYSHAVIAGERDHYVYSLDALFQFFVKHPERMPKHYEQALENLPRHRVVCDYIAGMTDHFLLRQCEDLGISRQ